MREIYFKVWIELIKQVRVRNLYKIIFYKNSFHQVFGGENSRTAFLSKKRSCGIFSLGKNSKGKKISEGNFLFFPSGENSKGIFSLGINSKEFIPTSYISIENIYRISVVSSKRAIRATAVLHFHKTAVALTINYLARKALPAVCYTI